MSPICILEGVPPRMCPTFRSCSISPATAEETQTTAATPSTAATPPVPETPRATISSAATTSVQSVSPETGLFDEPIMPTRLPETAAKKNPSTIMTPAATSAPAITLELARCPRAADEEVVERDHGNKDDGDAGENYFRAQVTLGAIGRLRARPRISSGRKPREPSQGKLLAHAEQRE